jgi:CRP-like cAMP-binding protein
MSGELNSDSITIGNILQSWFKQQGIDDTGLFADWVAAMTLQRLDKDALLVRAGDYSRHLFIVHSGLLRQYYTSAEGRERNKAFFGPGQVLGAVSAAITGKPAPFDIQALEPTVVVRADFHQLYQQAHQHPELSRVVIALLAEAFIRNEQREAMLLTCNAEQRYQWLCEHEAELLERLPQFHIASYIGVDAVSLSRLKRKL